VDDGDQTGRDNLLYLIRRSINVPAEVTTYLDMADHVLSEIAMKRPSLYNTT
jgi:hypothetical protein